jgi:type IV pilus assembly protein PilC
MSISITEFISELALLLESGISCGDALKIVQQGQEKPKMRKLVGDILIDVENDMSLADSFAKYPRYFEPFLVEILHSEGEQKQTATLAKIAQYRESMEVDTFDLTKKIALSSLYFIVLLFVLVILTTISLIYVVPVFADMFSSFGGELPGLTQFIINLSEFVGVYWIYIGSSVLILGGLLWAKWQNMILYIPLFGRLYRKIALVRLLRTCAFMLSEGASLTTAFAAAAQIVNNSLYAKHLNQVSQQVAEDKSLPDALQEKSIFPKKIIHAATVGLQTNKLDKLLAKMAAIYTKQLHQSIEPIIKVYTLLFTILVGFIVGLLIISMYLPIFMMGGAI